MRLESIHVNFKFIPTWYSWRLSKKEGVMSSIINPWSSRRSLFPYHASSFSPLILEKCFSFRVTRVMSFSKAIPAIMESL